MHTRFRNADDDGEAEILIYSPIGESDGEEDCITAHDFADNLRALGKVNSITVRMNCPGGDVFDGLSIYNALRDHPASVTVCVDGLAASAASFVAQAASPGKLYMARNSVMMIHSASGATMGNASDHRRTAAILDKLDQTIAGTYAKRSGRRTDTFLTMMAAETWMTADEAVGHKLADKITPAVNASACAGVGLLQRYKNIPGSIAARYHVATQPSRDYSIAARLAKLERDDVIYPQFATDRAAVANRLARLERDAIRWG